MPSSSANSQNSTSPLKPEKARLDPFAMMGWTSNNSKAADLDKSTTNATGLESNEKNKLGKEH